MKSDQSGQVVLMVVLTMLVGFTIALGVFLNSLSQSQLTTTQQNSERAFNTAEAGIEEYLKQDFEAIVGVGSTVDVGTQNQKALVTSEAINNFEAIIEQNSVATINVQGAKGAGVNSITIFWTDKGTDQNTTTCTTGDAQAPAGLIVQKWSVNTSVTPPTVSISNLAYQPYNCTVPSTSANFQAAAEGNATYRSSVTIPLTANEVLWRLRPVFNKAKITIVPNGGTLPVQQVKITSKSTLTSGESRAVTVIKSLPSLPEIFDYAVFSGNQIDKN